MIADRLLATLPVAVRVVAVDGRGGVGKSTLAASLGGIVVDTDEFFAGGDPEHWRELPPAVRADRAIDWRRLRDEAVVPLRAGRAATWVPYDWQRAAPAARAVTCLPGPVVVLDGTYSARPELADLVDLAVLVTADDAVRRARVLARGGDASWLPVWDEAEDVYFTTVRPPASFDIVVEAA